MSTSTLNVILDVVLIVAAVWMVITVRGLGGVIGRGLNLITIGALILGVAHLLATGLLSPGLVTWDSATHGFVHRVVVLVGFLVLVFGFRQIGTIKK
jgi:hypothetical protein